MTVRKPPLRLCAACSRQRPKRELLRVVRTPAGEVLLDPTGKMSGRGVYLCPEAGCLTAGLKAKALERALGVSLQPEALLALQDEAVRLVR